MRINVQPKRMPEFTHEGAKASHISPIQQLRRSVLSCLLWEDTFYESGESIAARISKNAQAVSPHQLASLAIEARQSFHLRHIPLLLLLELAKTAKGIPFLMRNTVESVISRADEMAEILSIYWKDGKKPLPHGLIKGLRQAALKFDAYQLNKWDRDGAVKLRDVIFISHINFPDNERSRLVANMANKSYFPEATKGGFSIGANLGLSGTPHLDPPETWEVLIAAAGNDKAKRREIWAAMLKKSLDRQPGGLGYMALLRNLRNMTEDGVNHQLIEAAIEARVGAKRILPFRFIQSAKVNPQFFRSLDRALQASVVSQEGLEGTTAVCVDCSGSMTTKLSAKGEVSRFDAAASLAGCINGRMRLVAFGYEAREISPIPGLGVITALTHSGVGHATNAHLAMQLVNNMKPLPDRVIIITDEQVSQSLPKPLTRDSYIINVGPYKNGIGYGDYTKIDGFSASTLDFIRESERAFELAA
jgi:hypothetical protein